MQKQKKSHGLLVDKDRWPKDVTRRSTSALRVPCTASTTATTHLCSASNHHCLTGPQKRRLPRNSCDFPASVSHTPTGIFQQPSVNDLWLTA